MTSGEALMIRVRELAEMQNISLYKILKENCIPRTTIVNLESGNSKNPGFDLIYKFSDAFNMTLIEFLDHPIFSKSIVDYI